MRHVDRNGLKFLIQPQVCHCYLDGGRATPHNDMVISIWGTDGESKLATAQSELHLEYHKNPYVEVSTSLG